MKKKKKIGESMESFMKRRSKETGKVTIPQTKPSPADSAGSHKTKAKALHVGVVKHALGKKLETMVKKKKKKALEEVYA